MDLVGIWTDLNKYYWIVLNIRADRHLYGHLRNCLVRACSVWGSRTCTTHPLILHSQTLHNLANIFYTWILRGDLGVHIGVYRPWNSVLFSNTWSNQSIFLLNPSTKLVLDCLSLWQNCYYFVTYINKFNIISINYLHMS